MIYFAQLPTGTIKIGKTDDLETRLYHLQRDYDQPLALLHVIEGGYDMERKIHQRFAHLRIKKTEQFKPGSDLMEFIGKPLLVSQNPEMAEAARRPLGFLRVSDQFIEAMRDVTGFEKVSTAEFADTVLLPIVQKRYREGVIRKAKQLEKGND